MKGTFRIKKTAHEVLLEEAVIKWRTSSTKARTTTPWNVAVQLQDVLCVDGSVNSTEKKATPPQFSLHYISKKPNHRWSHETVTFLTVTPEEDIDPWLKHIQQYCGRLQRPERLLVFINPVAGSGTGVKTYDKVAAPLFKLCDVKTDVIITENGEHAGKVLDQYDLSSIDGIVSVGGDGTFSQAFNGLLLRMAKDAGIDLNDHTQKPVMPSVPIGLIPAGSEQWMAYNANVVSDAATATLQIVTGQQHKIHIHSVHDADKFITFGAIVVGQGITGEDIYKTQSLRHLGPSLKYLTAAVWTLLQSIKSSEVKIHYRPVPQASNDPSNCRGTASKGSDGEQPAEPSVSDVNSAMDFSATKDGKMQEAVTADGWKVIEGTFCSIIMMQDQKGPEHIDKLLKQSQSIAPSRDFVTMTIHQVCPTASRVYMTKEIMGLNRGESQELQPAWGRQHDKVCVTHALEYKIIFTQEPDDRMYKWLNIDGEPFKIESKVIHVQGHPNLLPMFGSGHWQVISTPNVQE